MYKIKQNSFFYVSKMFYSVSSCYKNTTFCYFLIFENYTFLNHNTLITKYKKYNLIDSSLVEDDKHTLITDKNYKMQYIHIRHLNKKNKKTILNNCIQNNLSLINTGM